MKTTVELPDDLLIEAKKYAAEHRTTLRSILEKGLRHQLQAVNPAPRKIKWISGKGGLPPGLDVSNRAQMMEWMERDWVKQDRAKQR